MCNFVCATYLLMRFSAKYEAHSHVCQAHLLCYLLLCLARKVCVEYAVNCCCIQTPERRWAQFLACVESARPLALLRPHVSHVISPGAKKEVQGVAALRHIAFVEHAHTCRYGPDKQHECQPVSEDPPPFGPQRHVPPRLVVTTPTGEPALVQAAHTNMPNKSFFRGYSSWHGYSFSLNGCASIWSSARSTMSPTLGPSPLSCSKARLIW